VLIVTKVPHRIEEIRKTACHFELKNSALRLSYTKTKISEKARSGRLRSIRTPYLLAL
jgi:hypothetical protein